MTLATAEAGVELDLGTTAGLLNPGSVGQPRDTDPRAAWLLPDRGREGDVQARGLRHRRDAGGDPGARATPRPWPPASSTARSGQRLGSDGLARDLDLDALAPERELHLFARL